MVTFKEYTMITEGRYPSWLKFLVSGLILKVRGLSNQIHNETDPAKQNRLISKQSNLISYIVGLGIGVSTRDTRLISKIKKSVSPH